MKKKFLLLVLLAIACGKFFVQAQKRDYHIAKEPQHIPFGKKLPPPLLRPGEEKSHFQRIENEEKAKADQQGINDAHYDQSTRAFEIFGGKKNDHPLSDMRRDRENEPGGRQRKRRPVTDFHVSRDINLASSSEPSNYGSASNPHGFAVGNNVSYFAADDGIHGREVWRSNGTAAGTYLYKDVNPGEAGSDPTEITYTNNKLYFIASDATTGQELWVSDGTDIGTIRLTDIYHSPYGGGPSQIVSVGNNVFFTVSMQPYQATQLWKIGNEPGSNVFLYDFAAIGTSETISQCTAANGLLFFTTSSYNSGISLWRSDGTHAGTFSLRHFGYNNYTGAVQLTAYNGRLYFSADDGTGNKLWMSDGTVEGTTYAHGYNNVTLTSTYISSSYPIPFPIKDNQLYLSGHTPATGAALYKYDASGENGVELVKDISPSPDYNVIPPGYMIVSENVLYFKVINTPFENNEALWRSDGSEANTRLVKAFLPGQFAYNFKEFNGRLVFSVSDSLYGTEPWITDGANTKLIKDIMQGTEGSNPSSYCTVNGKFIFSARNDDGAELWTTNGTAFGTYVLKDINTHSTEGSYPGGFYPNDMAALGENLFFGAYTPRHGRELYQSDGTRSGTSLVKDINATPRRSAIPRWLLATKKHLYFYAWTYEPGFNKLEGIYKTDGTGKGTIKVVDLKNSSLVSYNVAENGIVFYTTYDYNIGGYALSRSDGTEAGTYLLSESLYHSPRITIKGNRAYFISGTAESGYELWRSDGSVAGTKMIKDIYPGTQSSYPYSLFEYKDKLYFGAYDGSSPVASFWKTDGTEKGTVKVKELTPGYGEQFYENSYAFSILNNTLYFSAFDYNSNPYSPYQLWKTDGSTAGTKLVKSASADDGSYLTHLVTADDLLFFITYGSLEYTFKLWASNGTEAGTRMVKDMSDDGEPADISRLVTAGGRLFFLKNRYRGNPELWSSDGTAENTQPVSDEGMDKITRVYNIASAKDKVFVIGYSYQYGEELHVSDVTEKWKRRNAVQLKEVPQVITGEPFAIKLFPNPAKSVATLLLNEKKANVSITITDISGKTVWQRRYVNVNSISLPMDKLSTGLYTVTVKDAFSTKTMKLVKQ